LGFVKSFVFHHFRDGRPIGFASPAFAGFALIER
jgi:hypothetical protein